MNYFADYVAATRAARKPATRPARGAAMSALDALAESGRDLLNPFEEVDSDFYPAAVYVQGRADD